jgi:anti-sigma regulatory factor (Ser/Thr protein kinase)
MASSAPDTIDNDLDNMALRFALGNDVSCVPALITHLQSYIDRFRLFDENSSIRVAIALEEAISNAIHHGNLELSSELREQNTDRYLRLVAERRQRKPYSERRVRLEARLSPAEAVFTITDEGPGFDPSALADPTTPANRLRSSGRGVFLIRTFMDTVHYNQRGNEVTMRKRRTPAPDVKPELERHRRTQGQAAAVAS